PLREPVRPRALRGRPGPRAPRQFLVRDPLDEPTAILPSLARLVFPTGAAKTCAPSRRLSVEADEPPHRTVEVHPAPEDDLLVQNHRDAMLLGDLSDRGPKLLKVRPVKL